MGYSIVGKLHKPVSFGPTLRLKASMLADGCTNVRGGNAAYDLIGVVQHHGRTPAGGHYTADVRCGGPGGEWMHFNDDRVATVDEAEVLQGNAYLLFYSRVAN
jgi:ubiquitin C-terminal hydrolase